MRRVFVSLALVAGSVASGVLQARVCSQCMCGTPFPADVLGGAVPMELRYGIEERYLSKSNALESEAGEEREREHRISGFVLWRAANRLAMLGRLPYNVKEITETPQGGPAATQRESGIGDAELLGLIGLTHGGEHTPTTALVLGGSAPTGSNEMRDESGTRLDAHLQPGTGAWSGTVGFHAALPIGHGSLGASVLGRFNGPGRHGYRYGDVLLYNLEYASPGRRGLRAVAEINGRAAKHDRLEDGGLGENTGGDAIYATPGLRWQSDSGIGIDAGIQIPVYESLFGEQDEHATGRLALSLNRRSRGRLARPETPRHGRQRLAGPDPSAILRRNSAGAALSPRGWNP